MIPKVIHYCWFGGNPLPELAQKCILSWKNHCANYEIKEWNESNFDLNCCDFVNEAYKAKKWAFVSDFARLKIIYEEGGIYLDTDVELIKPLDDLLINPSFLGEETSGLVNTGLGFGAEKHNPIIKELLEMYAEKHFNLGNGRYDMLPCPQKNTEPLYKYGYKFSGNKIWKSEYTVVYPPEYFCPLNYETGEMHLTGRTYSIHLYNASWHTRIDDIIVKLERCHNKESIEFKIRRGISFPFRVVNKISKLGVMNTLSFLRDKYSK